MRTHKIFLIAVLKTQYRHFITLIALKYFFFEFHWQHLKKTKRELLILQQKNKTLLSFFSLILNLFIENLFPFIFYKIDNFFFDNKFSVIIYLAFRLACPKLFAATLSYVNFPLLFTPFTIVNYQRTDILFSNFCNHFFLTCTVLVA